MIKSFADKEAERIYRRERSKKLPHDIHQVSLRKLRMIDSATSIDDLRIPPANRLEKLKGTREGQFSIRINRQWRICFSWQDGDAFDVAIVDYH